ncbi:RNA polymerase sigma factor SigJ [Actinoplanes sp. NPDC026670]|uniref:RNA polymerase sigma factor SigJ n=1 Tax=Actinoplanes sp. NPDC026670 TaxID=3154700 RepID=UPI0033E56697
MSEDVSTPANENRNADAPANGDGDGDANRAANADANRAANANAAADRPANAADGDAGADGDADADADGDADGDADAGADGDADGDADAGAPMRENVDAPGNGSGNGNGNTDANGNGNGNGSGNGNTDANGNGNATDETAAAGYRPLLFSIAYGMTGSVGDAEDIVQDAMLGLVKARRSGTAVTNLKAYLTTSVTRLGINHLGSARVRRETYVGAWLPEPLVAPAGEKGPAEHAELADSLSMAFLVLLEALSPVERAVFMLREVFGYGYPEVAGLVGRSEANCRQIFARARQRVHTGAAETPADRDRARDDTPARQAEAAALADRFFAAAAGGDIDALLSMLAPDVVLIGDGGGKAQALATPPTGRTAVARLFAGIFRRLTRLGVTLRPAVVNGRPGAVFHDSADWVVGVMSLDIKDGRVHAARSVVNPDKLHHLGQVSDLALRQKPDHTVRPEHPPTTDDPLP